MRDLSGKDVCERWMRDLFGLRLEEFPDPLGRPLPSRQVVFEGALAEVSPMMILTDFVVDRVFPVEPLPGTEVVASVRAGGSARHCIGTRRPYPGGGQAIYLGFRPRDDQAASTGIEVRTWYEILKAVGAYPASGRYADNDNPAVVSRSGDYVACAFPNGAVALAPHFRHYEETWPGGFYRDAKVDEEVLRSNPLPDDALVLEEMHVAGQSVTYRGRHAVTWRRNEGGQLIAVAGYECTGIQLDGQSFLWASESVDIAWHPLRPEHALPDCEPLYRVWCGSQGAVSVPLHLADVQGIEVWQGAYVPRRSRRATTGYRRVGYGQRKLPFELAEGALRLDVDEEMAESWLYVVRRKG